METLASILGSVALATPLTTPPPPRPVVVPIGYEVEVSGGRLVLVPGVGKVVNPLRPVYLPYDPNCRT